MAKACSSDVILLDSPVTTAEDSRLLAVCAIADQTSHAFTGQFRDRTTWMLLGGAASAVAGLVALLVPTNQKLGGGYAG